MQSRIASPISVFFVILFGLCTSLVEAHPFSVYLQEGFNTPGIPIGWTVTQVNGTTAIWNVVNNGTNPPIPPYAGSGQAKFNSFDAAPGHQSRLTSPGLGLSTASDPFVSFFLYHDDEWLSSGDSVYMEVTTADSVAGPWTTLAGYRRPRTNPGWGREVVSLIQYAGVSKLFVSFRGVSQYGNNMYLEEVRLADSAFHDIGSTTLLSPAGLPGVQSLPDSEQSRKSKPPSFAGLALQEEPLVVVSSVSPVNLGIVVQNYGTFPEPSYQVRWNVDGQDQPAVVNSRPLTRNGRDTLLLSWLTPSTGTHTVTAWTFLAGDTNSTNDSVRLSVAVLDSSITYSEMFNSSTFPPPGWSTINRDGGSLLPWFGGSFISAFVPYEGTGFAANNFQRANGTYIDDYLISPPVPGIAQAGRVDSLGFRVRSAFNPPPQENYPDSLMVLLSTTGVDTSNFTVLLDYFPVPKTSWSLKRYSLTGRVPTNSTIRIAFRYLHYNGGSTGSSSDFVGVDFVHVDQQLPTTVEMAGQLPAPFALQQNYPNPFNPSTEIEFSVQTSGQTQLDVFNVLGQKVTSLYSGIANAGRVYRLRFDATGLAGGVYWCRLQNVGRSDLRKMVFLK